MDISLIWLWAVWGAAHIFFGVFGLKWLQLALGVSLENMDTSHGEFQSELVKNIFKSGKLLHSFNDDIFVPLMR